MTNQVSSTSLPSSNNCTTGSTDFRCAVTVPVARLELQQYAAETSATPGSIVHLTAIYTNTGQVPYTGISVSSPRANTSDDTIPTGDQVASSGTLVRTADAVTWTGNIAVGATITITRTLTVKNPDPGNQVITATLASTASGNNCQSGTTDPRCTFSVAVVTPKLTISKTASSGAVVAGGTSSYTITVNNNGQTPYSGASVTDSLTGVLDDATYNANATATTGSVSYGAPTLTWTGNLAVGATATITYSVTTKNPDPGDKFLTNGVTSTEVGSTCPPATNNTACRTSVPVLTPALTITKTADVANATLGATVTYTVVAKNTGQTYYSAAAFDDSLAAVLDDATYNAETTTATSGTTAYANDVLSWSGALAPGASATITYSVTIAKPATGDLMMTNTVTSTTAGNNCPASSTDTRCRVQVAVTNAYALTFTKTSGAPSTVAGAHVAYTVTVTNASAADITGVDFTDPLGAVLDDATYDNNVVASSGTVSYAGSAVSWTGTVAAGATITVTYSVTVLMASTGNQILTGTVSSTSYPSSNNCLAGSADARCTNTVTVSSLVIENAAEDPNTTPGSLLEWSTTFTNTGQTPYVGISISTGGADLVDDVIPLGNETASSGSLGFGDNEVVWTGSIPVGGTVTVSASFTVLKPDTGNHHIFSSWHSGAAGNNCPVSSTDPRCSTSVTVLEPGLTVTKTANTNSTVPGGTVGYTIVVTNSGQTAYPAAAVSDSLIGVLDDASYNSNAAASSGTVSYSSPTLSWTGALAVGASATISYSVTVNSAGAGDNQLVNPVSSSADGSSCPPGSGNAGCISSVDVLHPALTITKSADLADATYGSTVTYSVLVSNTGQTDYSAAAFSDSLAQVLDDASYLTAATSATSGTVDYSAGVLSWSGALAVGASATISYAVRVNTPAAGNRSLNNTITSGNAGSNCAANSTDGRCTAVVRVIDAVALTFTRTASVASTVPGGVVTYTVRVANASKAAVSSVNFTDPLSGVLDDAAYNSDAVASAGTVSYSASTLSWSGTVPAESAVTVTYSVTVAAAGTGDELLTNQVSSTSLASSNNCTAGSTDSRCVSTVPVARLELQQSSDQATATPGTLITVTGTFTNTGQVAYTGLSIALDTANVTDDATAEGDTASSGVQTRTATGLTWTGDIAVGQTITTSRLLRVRKPDPGNKLVTATYLSTAAANNCAAGSTDPRCTFAVTVLTPGLAITKAASVTSVVPNGVVGYTITVANTGQTAYTGATVTDALTGVLDDATYAGDAAATTGTVSYSAPNLTWIGALAVGATATITFSVTAHRPADGDKTMLNRVSSTDVGSTCPPASAAAACTNTVEVRTPALTTVLTASKTTALPGDVVTYSVTATNTGQTDYTTATFNAPLTDLLDDAVYAGDATASSGTVVRTGDSLVWTGALVQGAQATISFSVTVLVPVPVTGLSGSHRLQLTLTSIRNGSNCLAGSSDPRCGSSVPIASLQITNSADVATTSPTGVVNYTVTFTNTGQVPYVGSTINYDLVNAVDDSVYNGDAAASSGNLTVYVGFGRVTWTGDVAVGDTVTITGSVTIKNPDPGNKIVTTKVIATDALGSNCATGSTDNACVSNVSVLTPALTITKVADRTTTTPGGTVAYTITATNTGQTAYSGASLRDDLMGAATDSAYNADASATSGTLSFAADVLTWTGALAVNQSVTITYSLQVDNPDHGDRTLVNRVTSDAIGSTCPTGGTAPACTSTVSVLVPALDIAVTSGASSTTPGSSVAYTLTIRNVGQTAYTGATVTASLAAVLDDAAYAGGATATTGSVTYSDPNLTWTGDLAVNATATVTYSVTVNNPDVGNRTLTTSVSSAEPGSTCSAGSPCVNTVNVLIPGLAVSTTADVATAQPGDVVTFSISVHNTGQTAYVGTTITTALNQILDDATFDGAVTASSGTASRNGANLTWTGSLAVGESALITYRVRVDDPDQGDRTMSTTVLDTSAGSTCPAEGSSPSCTAVVAIKIPTLTINKTASAATATPGEVVHYTIVVTNTGETNYTAATLSDSLSGVLTDATYNTDAVVTGGGTVSYSAPVLTWTGDLLTGASASITYSVTVKASRASGTVLTNSVASTARGSTCPPGSTLPACTVQVQVLIPALQVTKTVDRQNVVAGSPVAYTITLTNTGETDYAPATFTDPLTDVLDDATYSGGAVASSGTVAYVNDTLTWSGALVRGASATVTYSVTASYPAPADGDKLLLNQVYSASAGATCPAGGSHPACRTSVTVLVPELTVTKTADTSVIVAGGTVSYTITATNTGQSGYPAASLADALSGVLDDAVYNGNATATHGHPEL